MGCHGSTEKGAKYSANTEASKSLTVDTSRHAKLADERSPLPTPTKKKILNVKDGKSESEKKKTKNSPPDPNEEIQCPNSWCSHSLDRVNLKQHLHDCQLNRPVICFLCGQLFTQKTLKDHTPLCKPVRCKLCKQTVTPHLIEYCPISLLSAKSGQYKTPFEIAKQLRKRATSRFTTRQDRAAAKIQHLFRYRKVQNKIIDAFYRTILKDIALARENFIVRRRFSASESSTSLTSQPLTRKRSLVSTSCSKRDIPEHHYFPRDDSVPITKDVLRAMISDFQSGHRLPYAAAWRLCDEVLSHFSEAPNVNVVQHLHIQDNVTGVNVWKSKSSRVVVIGDLHGQLPDLLYILRENGLPSESNRLSYVFNGDFVDRGANSVEIMLLIYCMIIVEPKNVFVNRGNHEVYYMNEDYGFDIEVVTKYDRAMYHLIQRTFTAIPLATVIFDQVFVVHGGLPRVPGITCDYINSMNRRRPAPIPEENEHEEDIVFQDLLWSDPWDSKDIGVNERGAGILFGTDITENFLATNGYNLVIRSHEPFLNGYEQHHNGKVVTIFSAANYSGEDSNRGSYAIINSKTPGRPTFHSFMEKDTQEAFFSASISCVDPLTHSATQNNTTLLSRSTKDEVLRHIRERIYFKRHELLKQFNNIDSEFKGTVWKVEWVEVMRTTLCMDLPWYFLRRFFVDVTPDGHVKYPEFLARFRNRFMCSWVRKLEKIVLKKFCDAVGNVQLFNNELQHNQKLLSFGAFERIVHSLGIRLCNEELFQLFTFFDPNFKGHIQVQKIQKFLEESTSGGPHLAAVPSSPVSNTPRHAGDTLWEIQVMSELQRLFISGRMDLQRAFRMMDSHNIGSLDFHNFEMGMKSLNRAMRSPLQTLQLKQLFDIVDVDKDGRISLDDFLNSFSVYDIKENELPF